MNLAMKRGSRNMEILNLTLKKSRESLFALKNL